jgi:outer membrane protein assembly factor BamB
MGTMVISFGHTNNKLIQMNRLKIIVIFVFSHLWVISCEKPDPIIPIEPSVIEQSKEKYPTNLEVLWEAFFHSDSVGDFFWDYAVAGEQYLVLANIYDRINDKPRGIGVYNMQTGQQHPAWQNDPGGIFAAIEREDLKDYKIAGKNKDIILIYSGKNLFAYSLHTRQRLWNLDMTNISGLPRISAVADHAFVTYGPAGYAASPSWYRLAIVDVYSGKKSDILQLSIEDNYRFAINPPSAYINGSDTLLYFTTSGWNFTTVHGRVYTYCYNMTKKQIVWVNKQFTIDTDATFAQPSPFVIENDRLIVTSLRAIHCFDQHTGELIWQREGLGFADKPPLYYDGKIYIRSSSFTSLDSYLLCLDAQSGQILWENNIIKSKPAFHGMMAIYKDRLFFSASGNDATYHLTCVDIYTGKELWHDHGPYGDIAFGVLIDQKTGYLYCNTNWSTLCVDLNKTPNK